MKELERSVVLVDKPEGITSGEAVRRVKEKLKIEKAGHCGTLDPGATGLLIVVLGESTKAASFFLKLDKTYTGIIQLHQEVLEEKIKEIFLEYTGKIIQRPPKKSAVKRERRKREIYSLKLLRKEGREVHFEVKCESGTYIRKLASDMGKKTGGAHVKDLRRTRIGNISIDETCTLEDLNPDSDCILSLEEALERIGLKKIEVKPNTTEEIKNGSPLKAGWIKKADESIKRGDRVGFFSEGRIIALGTAKRDHKELKGKGTVGSTDRIFE